MNVQLKSWISAATVLLLITELLFSNAFTHPSHHSLLKQRSSSFAVILQAASAAATTNYESSPVTNDNISIFLRFSPLVGGPPFLPLHVEVLLVHASSSIGIEEQKQQINHLLQHPYDATPSNTYFDIHRFDFLPQNPRDGDTIVRLLQLKSVRGNVRYRYIHVDRDGLLQSNENENESMVKDINDGVIQSAITRETNDNKGVAILLRLGSASTSCRSPQSILSTATAFAEDYKTTAGKELRILGGKNCISFALDLLWCLNEVHGIDIDVSVPKLF